MLRDDVAAAAIRDDAGWRKTLIPGVRPITMRDRLEARMEAPLIPRKPQKPLDIGLFDEIGRNQLDLFWFGEM